MKRRSSIALLATFAAATVLASLVVPSTRLAAEPADKSIVVEKDVIYGKGGDVDLQLDIARPKGKGPFPAIVFIHGGGWRAGARQIYSHEIERAARRGYVAATVTYRLTNDEVDEKPKYPFPAQVHDVKCAVRWLRANAEKYHVDPDRVGVTGASAGGHLSLMVGLADSSAGLEGNGGHAEVSSRVQAVVNFVGPTDMVSGYETTQGGKPLLAKFLGGTPEEAPENYKAASPVTHASGDDPPVLSFFGNRDFLVPLSQGELLDEKMKEIGASHTLVVMHGQGHGFKEDSIDVAIAAMYGFFDKHLKKK